MSGRCYPHALLKSGAIQPAKWYPSPRAEIFALPRLAAIHALWPFRRVGQEPRPTKNAAHWPYWLLAIGYWLLAIGYSEIPVVLDVALADDFPSAVNQVELAELIVLVFQVDCPVSASGSSGICTPG